MSTAGEEGGRTPSHGVDHADARTRDRVRQAVSERGPVTAAAIAGSLGLTAAGVRRHLDALAADGVISEHEAPATGERRRGRPARAWVLSQAGHAQMPADEHVAADALRFMAEQFGDEAVARFAQGRVASLEERYGPVLEAAGPDPLARAEALAAALNDDGYAASARRLENPGETHDTTDVVGVQLCQGHCPVQSVASEFTQFCDAETEAISRLLGVHVQRLQTLAHGGHVCTTFVPLGAVRAHGQPVHAGHHRRS